VTSVGFADQLIASAALGNPTDPWGAAKRWVPWLCAYSGARVGELTQLRVQDVEHRACGPVLRITPDAGRPARPAQSPYIPIWSRWVCWTTSRRSRLAWGSRGLCSSGLRHDLPAIPTTAVRQSRPVRGWLGGCGNSGSPTLVSNPTTPGGTPSSAEQLGPGSSRGYGMASAGIPRER
jgi:hypothetical protein